MGSYKTMCLVNPVRLCAVVVLIITAPKVLTETNCECLILSKQSGDEWIEDCGDSTTAGFTSTTYTITTPGDIADPGRFNTTAKPNVTVPSSDTLKPTSRAPGQTTKAVTLTTKTSIPTPKPTTKATIKSTKAVIPTPKPTTKATIKTTKPAVPTPKPTTKKPVPLTTKLSVLKTSTKVAVNTPVSHSSTHNSAGNTTTKLNDGGFQAEPVPEPTNTGSVIGGVVGAVVGVAALVSAAVLFWKLGVIKRLQKRFCKRSKVGTYDVENGEVTQNGTKPGDKTLKAS